MTRPLLIMTSFSDIFFYIQQFGSSVWMSLLAISIHFSEFMSIIFTRKRTKHENARSPPFSHDTKMTSLLKKFPLVIGQSRLIRSCLVWRQATPFLMGRARERVGNKVKGGSPTSYPEFSRGISFAVSWWKAAGSCDVTVPTAACPGMPHSAKLTTCLSSYEFTNYRSNVNNE